MAVATVQAIMALFSTAETLYPVTDELRTRVQSIRVRSLQEMQDPGVGRRNAAPRDTHRGNDVAPWRNKQSDRSHTSTFTATRSNTTDVGVMNHWRQASQNQTQSYKPSPVALRSTVPTRLNSTTAPARYISKFHSGSKTGDDQILNTVILNKLNIFSVQTYDDVKQFLFQILGSDQKFIREFTWLVFRKAAAEDKFCGLFAKLLSEIKKEYPVILEEMRNLHTTYLDIWDITETTTAVDRRCRLGYSQFMAELTALGVLESSTMQQTLEMLKKCILRCLNDADQQSTVEEYMDCLRQLCGSKVPMDLRNLIRDILVTDLETWIGLAKEYSPGLSSKSRFACMDLRDLLLKSQ